MSWWKGIIRIAVALMGVAGAMGAPGDLDATFDGDGVVINNLGGIETGGAVAQLASGKLLMTGSGNGSTSVHTFVRYNLDGSVDTTFGTSGAASGMPGGFWGFSLLDNGGWFVCSDYDTGSFSELNDAALVKYTSSGTVDTSFGTNGRVIFNYTSSPASEVATAALELDDGKILVGGWFLKATLDTDAAIVRLTATGALDTSFGTDGVVTFDRSGGVDKVTGLIPQSGGKFIVYGEAVDTAVFGKPSEIFFRRYSAEGVLDTTFGTGGTTYVRTDVNSDLPGGYVVLDNGKILFAINGTAKYSVGRLTVDGVLDTSFSGDGVADLTATLPGVSFPAMQSVGVAVQPNGRIVVGGWISGFNTQLVYRLGFARFDPDGTVDTTFGVNGSITHNVSDAAPESAINVIAQSDGKIVLGGYLPTGSDDRFLVRIDGGDAATTIAPVAADDAYVAGINTALSVLAPGVLANDTDANDDALTAVIGTQPANGSVTLNADGSFTYTPNTDYSGTDTFTYTAFDGQLNSNAATVGIIVGAGQNLLVSIMADGTQGNNASTDPHWDLNGTKVVFQSVSTSFPPASTSGWGVYMVDIAASTPEVVPVSVDADGTPANNSAESPRISADGSCVVFSSYATNLTGVTFGSVLSRVFLKDLGTDAVELISQSTAGAVSDGFSSSPRVSADGRYVLFRSTASNLTATSTNSVAQWYLRDRTNQTTTLVTVDGNGNAANNHIQNAYLGSGPVVVFQAGDAVIGPGIWMRDVDAGTTTLVSRRHDDSALTSADLMDASADGTQVLFGSNDRDVMASDTVSGYDLYVRDIGTGGLVRVNEKADGSEVDEAPSQASFSYNGDYVTFVSLNGLVDFDTNFLSDVYLYDLTGDELRLVSIANDGSLPGSNVRTYPSQNGRTVLFAAFSAMIESDVNDITDVYIHDFDLAPAPPANDPPEGAADAYSVIRNGILTVPAPGVLSNDTDAEGHSLSAVTTLAAEPAHGTAVLAADGSFTYTPTAGFSGIDSFSYVVTDPYDQADSSTTVTITVEDTDPQLSIGDANPTEGDTGVSNTIFAVTLSPSVTVTVTVQWTTFSVTASAGTDYQSDDGVLTFYPGESSKTISVGIVGDQLDEEDEGFEVSLSSPTNATILDGTGTGTILDDDTAEFEVADVEVAETEESVEVTFTLSTPSSRTVSFDYTTIDGTALAAQDYTAASGSLSFDVGETEATVTIGIIGDSVQEGNHAFSVIATAITNATVTDATGIVTILDDDVPLISLSVDASLEEGDSGTNLLGAGVTLSEAGIEVITVDYEVVGGTATAGQDFIAASGTLTFAVGAQHQQINVTWYGDTLVEEDETFFIHLSNPTNATIDRGTSIYTVENDDTPSFSLTVTPTTFSEGAGTHAATGTISRNFMTELVVSLSSSDTSEATVPTAVTLPTNVLSATFAIDAVDDELHDGSQQVTITATANDLDSQAFVVTVQSDDQTANVVYDLVARKTLYSANGGGAGTLTGSGYLVVDLTNHQAARFVKWSNGDQLFHTYEDLGSWYTARVGTSDYWFFTNGGSVVGSTNRTYNYRHMYGPFHGAPLPLGGDVNERIPINLSGLLRAGGSTETDSYYSPGTQQARINLTASQRSNNNLQSFTDLVIELSEAIGVTPFAVETVAEVVAEPPIFVSQSEGPIMVYLLTRSALNAGNGSVTTAASVGYLVIDFFSQEAIFMKVFREGGTLYYEHEPFRIDNQFWYNLQLGSATYRFLGNASEEPTGDVVSPTATGTFRFYQMFGASRTLAIGGVSADTVPLSLTGEFWEHQVQGDATGLYTQGTLVANVRGETVIANQNEWDISQTLTYLSSLFPGIQPYVQ